MQAYIMLKPMFLEFFLDYIPFFVQKPTQKVTLKKVPRGCINANTVQYSSQKSSTLRTWCKIFYFNLQTENGDDFVKIYDGTNDQSTEIEKLSGNLGSFKFSSIGNSLFVKFESNNWDDGSTGFLALINHGSPYDSNNSLKPVYSKSENSIVLLFL